MWKVGIILLFGAAILFSSFSCGSSGVPQEDYDAVVNELAAADEAVSDMQAKLAEAEVMASQYVEINAKYKELQKQYDNAVAEKETLDTQYSALEAEHESLQAQNQYNLNTITMLEIQYEQLQAQYDALTGPVPEVTVDGLEQALMDRINQLRSAAGLTVLDEGGNLRLWAERNSQEMVVSKVLEQFTDNWVPYQLEHIAGGYSTIEEIVAATILIWQSNDLQYQNNLMADDSIYGVVAVAESGGIYYISFLSSNFG
jgi:multidrug efflux pump subunit AcrA (membrane-fusion protein)